MNNSFDFKRFGQVLAYDWKRYVRNFGITLLVWISMPILLWVASLVLGTELPVEAREMLIFGIVAITLMSAPSRIYGKANLSREGVAFAMLPASGLEKFLTMFIYCSLVTPALALLGAWIVDSLLSLLPFGGFEEIAMYEDFLRKISFGDFVMLVVSLVTAAWAESSIFMFGNARLEKPLLGESLLCLYSLCCFNWPTSGMPSACGLPKPVPSWRRVSFLGSTVPSSWSSPSCSISLPIVKSRLKNTDYE